MITITTKTKRFTLKTDSDQSDKLFNEIVCHLIGRKPSGGGSDECEEDCPRQNKSNCR